MHSVDAAPRPVMFRQQDAVVCLKGSRDLIIRPHPPKEDIKAWISSDEGRASLAMMIKFACISAGQELSLSKNQLLGTFCIYNARLTHLTELAQCSSPGCARYERGWRLKLDLSMNSAAISPSRMRRLLVLAGVCSGIGLYHEGMFDVTRFTLERH